MAGIARFWKPDRVWTPGGEVDIHRIYFTSRKTVARSYGLHLYRAALYFANPLVLDAKGQTWGRFFPVGYIAGALASECDGLVIQNLRDDSSGGGMAATTFICFNPDQVVVAAAPDAPPSPLPFGKMLHLGRLGCSDWGADPAALPGALEEAGVATLPKWGDDDRAKAWFAVLRMRMEAEVGVGALPADWSERFADGMRLASGPRP